jgi:hypothetical protein
MRLSPVSELTSVKVPSASLLKAHDSNPRTNIPDLIQAEWPRPEILIF